MYAYSFYQILFVLYTKINTIKNKYCIMKPRGAVKAWLN